MKNVAASSDQKSIDSLGNSGLIQLLRSLSPGELKRFSRFIESPYFNTDKCLTELFNFLIQYYSEFTSEHPGNLQLNPTIAHYSEISSDLFRKRCSRLRKLVEKFLVTEKLNSDENQTRVMLCRILSSRNLFDLNSKGLALLEKSLEKSKVDFERDLAKHQLAYLKYIDFQIKGEINRAHSQIRESDWHLMKYFLFKVAANYSQLSLSKLSYNLQSDSLPHESFFRNFNMNEFLEELSSTRNELLHEDFLVLKLIALDVKLHDSMDSLETFNEIENILVKYGNMFSKNHLYYYSKRLISYCVLAKYGSIKDFDFEKMILRLYVRMIEQGLLLTDIEPNLDYGDFRTMLFSSIKTGKLKWFGKFINEHLAKAVPELRESMNNIILAHSKFNDRRFDEALQLVNIKKPNSEIMNIDLYCLRIQCLYELGYFDSALNILDTFRHYLTGERRSISGQLLKTFNYFVNYTRQLINLNRKFSKLRASRLRDELTYSKRVARVHWLIEKIQELPKLG